MLSVNLQVMEWFASRVDRILILFDANKLDISDELRKAIQALKAHDEKVTTHQTPTSHNC
jgi:EH domain-containing protein 1